MSLRNKIASLPSSSNISLGMKMSQASAGADDVASYPVVDLGEILYPNRHDLRNKIQLFANDEEEDEDDDNDDELKFMHSTSHDRLCQIQFVNESESTPIYCYWIEYNCEVSTPPHSIAPESSLRLNSYLFNPFIISTCDALDADTFDSIIAVYIATNDKHLIHNVAIDANERQITVSPFEEDIKPRCKCGRILIASEFDSSQEPEDDTLYVCFGCDRDIADGDRVWTCDNVQLHALKIYCLSCAQQRSQPLGLIRAFRSDIDTDYCCNEKYRNYPRNFPRLFQIHLFIENLLRITSLSCDLWLLYILIDDHSIYENAFFNHLSDLESMRLLFTLLPGFILCIVLLLWYYIQIGCALCCSCKCCHKNTDDEEELDASEKRIGILKMICIILTCICLIFLCKVLMIVLCIVRIVFVLKQVTHHKAVPADVEIKHVLLLYPLLYDELFSAWPLLMISLVELVYLEDMQQMTLYTCVLFAKVIASSILIFVDIDRLRLWRYSMHDPKMLVPVCILHTSRPYPMRAVQLTSSNAGKCCVMCGDVCHDGEYVWLCAHKNCHGNTVCTECTFQYLGKYQQDQQMEDETFYDLITTSTHFSQIYKKQIKEFAATNDLGNGQKHCWYNLGFWIWFLKCMYNIFVFCLLIIGCWVFQKVWLLEYFSIDGDIDNDEDSAITTIYGSLFVCVSLVFELILIIIQCTFLMPHSKIEASVPRIIFNLFFVFYLCGFSLLLFDYQQLSTAHYAIQLALIGFSVHLGFIPLLSVWQVISSNMYLWQ